MFSKSMAYATQALLFLAEHFDDPDKLWQTGELAESTGLPSSFLSKVLQQLSAAELIESIRGRGGGIRLKVHPDKIALYQVAQAVGDYDGAGPDLPGWDEASDEIKEIIQQKWTPYKHCLLEFLGENSIGTFLEAKNLMNVDR